MYRIFLNIKYFTTDLSIYIFSLLLFVVNNKTQFWMNSKMHKINTRNNSEFCQSLSHLTIYQKVSFIFILMYITVFHLK